MLRPGKRKRTAEVVIFDKDSRADYLTGWTYSMASTNSFTDVVGRFRLSQAKSPANEESARRGCAKSKAGQSQGEERGTFFI